MVRMHLHLAMQCSSARPCIATLGIPCAGGSCGRNSMSMTCEGVPLAMCGGTEESVMTHVMLTKTGILPGARPVASMLGNTRISSKVGLRMWAAECVDGQDVDERRPCGLRDEPFVGALGIGERVSLACALIQASGYCQAGVLPRHLYGRALQGSPGLLGDAFADGRVCGDQYVHHLGWPAKRWILAKPQQSSMSLTRVRIRWCS